MFDWDPIIIPEKKIKKDFYLISSCSSKLPHPLNLRKSNIDEKQETITDSFTVL